MKESYGEGRASHIGPESCAFVRKNKGEALTGERAGRVWSREDPRVQGADAVLRVKGNTVRIDNARVALTLRGQRPRARTEALYTGAGRSHICLWVRGNRRLHREV